MTTTLSIPMKDGNTLEIPVKVLEEREVFGRYEVQVTPVSGSGQAWVSADRVKVTR